MSDEDAVQPLLETRAVAALRECRGDREIHLVGGAVRDALLARPWRDIDAVASHDAAGLAHVLAAALGATAIEMGEKKPPTWRVAKRDFVLDLVDLEGGDLDAELFRRDFTLNALAVPLDHARILDPTGGREDLEARRLRIPRPDAFDEDALRVLRLVRFTIELGAEPTEETLDRARRSAASLDEVAVERIREEWAPILVHPDGAEAFPWLERLGRPAWPWREGEAEAGKELEVAWRRGTTRLGGRDEPFAAPGEAQLRTARLAWAAEDTDNGGETLARWRREGLLTRTQARAAAAGLGLSVPRAVPEMRWFLYRTGLWWPASAVVASRSSDDETATDLLGALRAEAERGGADLFAPSPLLDGDAIARVAGLEPGPALGEMVGALRRAQVEERIRTAEEAVDAIRSGRLTSSSGAD